MTPPVIRMDDVKKHYGDVRALDGVTLELEEHAIHGLLGRNGAGKTTIMQILTAQAFETSGTVEVFGRHPYENPAVLGRICFIKESQRYPDSYRVEHVLRAASFLFPHWDEGFARDLVGEFDLPTRRHVKKLSRGMLSSVGVIIGLASRAPVTFFDEPYLGLDAVARQLFYDRLLADYAEHPRTVVLSTHLIDEVSDLVEHVVLVDQGRVVLQGSADDLRARAVTVTGPQGSVQPYAEGHEVLHREQLGSHLRLTLVGSPGAPAPPGVVVEPVSLQQLVIRTTQAHPGTAQHVRDDALERSTP